MADSFSLRKEGVVVRRTVWLLACRYAESGRYANVIEIEAALQEKQVLSGMLTNNTYLRDVLTRLCHRSRTNSKPATSEISIPAVLSPSISATSEKNTALSS